MSETLRVEFAYPYTDRAGKNHNPDASAVLPLEEAHELIHFGRARVAKDTASTANASKEK